MTLGRSLLLLHGAAVLGGLIYLGISVTVGSTPDANIGAGLALLWLAALGSPWAWILLALDTSDGLSAVIATVSAAINLALHIYFRRRPRSTTAE